MIRFFHNGSKTDMQMSHALCIFTSRVPYYGTLLHTVYDTEQNITLEFYKRNFCSTKLFQNYSSLK